ncbi:MAG: addiction module protein [Thermodesulfobacteriota bacterium]|nr:addiction module protein [Thermodesulfobacteriota bacterium]
MKAISSKDTLSLSIPERILLVEDIWDTIVEEIKGTKNLTNEDKKIIDQRLEAYNKNPDGISEWKDVYNRIIETNEL